MFEAEAYFMLDATQLAMGAWIGYDERWKFGPLRVEVEAWIEGNAVLSWKPNHFHGDLWLHGKAELAVWRFDTGLDRLALDRHGKRGTTVRDEVGHHLLSRPWQPLLQLVEHSLALPKKLRRCDRHMGGQAPRGIQCQ